MSDQANFTDFVGAMSVLVEEKGLPKEKVHEVVEAALAAAYKKEYGQKGQNIRAELSDVSGEMKFFLMKEVVDESTRDFVSEEDEVVEEEHAPAEGGDDVEERKPRFNAERDITIEDAQAEKKGAALGDILETQLETKTDFGRVAAQTAKQVIIQRIREAERDAMYEEFKEKEGEIVGGTVQRLEGRTVFIDLGKSVGALYPREQVRGEHYTIGQRIKVYVERVDSDPKGPGVVLSRVHPQMVARLFELEVPEIFAGTVEIKAISREAGSRTKMAVYSEEEGIDPIGSCVGQRGTRVNAIIDELGGEKIDIIEWSEDTEDFIAAALAPAQVLSVEIQDIDPAEQTEKDEADEEVDQETDTESAPEEVAPLKKAVVVVPDDQLSLAIGKRGQNVRLAVKLAGMDIDVESASGEAKESGDTKETDKDANEAEQSTDAERPEKTDAPEEEVTNDAPTDAPEEAPSKDAEAGAKE